MIRAVQRSVIVMLLFVAACGSSETPDRIQGEVAPSAASSSATPAREGKVETHDIITFVILGDSLTAGYGLTPEEALPAVTEQILRRTHNHVRIINAGVSGDTTANGLARYDWSVGSADADVLVIALGANDYLMGLSPDLARENLTEIIELAQASGLQVILAGLEMRSDAVAGSRDAAFAAIYPELAEAYSVDLFPALLRGVRNDPSKLQPDGLHPTADGVNVIAERLADFLEQVVNL